VGPAALDPAQWMAFLSALPRSLAALVWIASLSMLVFGLRGYRYFLIAGAMLAAGGGGWALAGLMHVTGWYVAIPAVVAALAVGVFAFVALRLLAVTVVCACFAALFVVRALELPAWAIAFAGGAVAGLVFAYLAPRFSAALLASIAGTFGALATLGALFRVPGSPFGVKAYVEYPMTYVVVGLVMALTALVAQLVRDPVSRGAVIEESMPL
jgi:hypothetical protein